MAKWHLDELEQAVLRRGWRVEVKEDADHPVPDGVWSLKRGDRELLLEFSRFGGDGAALSDIGDCYSCDVASLKLSGPYFYKRGSLAKWRDELRAFVDALDAE